MVDFERPGRVEIAKWIVGKGGQVNHGVEAAQVLDRNVAHVFADGRCRVPVLTEYTVAKKFGVQTDDVVAFRPKIRRHNRADVALVTGNKDAHQIAFTSSGIGWIESPRSMSW